MADVAPVKPGEPFWVALRQTIRPKWHTYWKNPGEFGLPTEIKWTLPAGAKAGPIVWPTPQPVRHRRHHQLRLPGRVVLLVQHHAAGRPRRRTLKLAAEANWLVCEDVCIPEEGKFELGLPVGHDATPAPPATRALFDRRAARVPIGKPVAGALRPRQVGRSDPGRRGQGAEGRHDPRRLFLSRRMGRRSPPWPSRTATRRPPRASASRSGRATPRRRCPSDSPARWC